MPVAFGPGLILKSMRFVEKGAGEIMEQDFSCRSHQLEMIDGDAISFEDFRECLHDLEIVNVCTNVGLSPHSPLVEKGLARR